MEAYENDDTEAQQLQAFCCDEIFFSVKIVALTRNIIISVTVFSTFLHILQGFFIFLHIWNLQGLQQYKKTHFYTNTEIFVITKTLKNDHDGFLNEE